MRLGNDISEVIRGLSGAAAPYTILITLRLVSGSRFKHRKTVMIKHKIRAKNGGTRSVNITPLKAIRLQCVECMGFSVYEPAHCTSPLCSLYPYRLGKRPEHKYKNTVENLKRGNTHNAGQQSS